MRNNWYIMCIPQTRHQKEVGILTNLTLFPLKLGYCRYDCDLSELVYEYHKFSVSSLHEASLMNRVRMVVEREAFTYKGGLEEIRSWPHCTISKILYNRLF